MLDIADAITIIRPETLIGWRRAGFRAWWRWKSRNRGSRPKVDRELRDLFHRMCEQNPLWGPPRIHGELLKLDFLPRAPDRIRVKSIASKSAADD